MPNHTTTFAWTLAACAAATLVGCSKTEVPAPPPHVMPEVNDANCATAAIKAMPADDARQRFADMCARRGSYTPSAKKVW